MATAAVLLTLLYWMPSPLKGPWVETAPDLTRIALRTNLFERTLRAAAAPIPVITREELTAAPVDTPTDDISVDRELEALHARVSPLADALDTAGVSIERPCVAPDEAGCGRYALDRLLDRMTDTLLGRTDTPVRWAQFGDSLTAWSLLVGELRELTQAQFGDAGHGFVYLDNPLDKSHEQQSGIALEHGDFYVRSTLFHDDPAFGLSGIAFRPLDDSWTRITRTSDSSSPFERLGLLFQSETGHATLRVATPAGANTYTIEGEPGVSSLAWIDVPPSREVTVDSFEPSVTWHGLLAERQAPGFVVDNIGLVRGRIGYLRKIRDWERQLALRDPDVVAFFYGSVTGHDRDPAFLRNPSPAWRDALRDDTESVYARLRDALPDRDCLVIGHLTRAERGRSGVREVEQTAVTVDIQRRAAQRTGCAFWDSHAVVHATGGPEAWNAAKPQLLGQDLRHLRRAGSEKVAGHLYAALVEALRDRLSQRLHRDKG